MRTLLQEPNQSHLNVLGLYEGLEAVFCASPQAPLSISPLLFQSQGAQLAVRFEWFLLCTEGKSPCASIFERFLAVWIHFPHGGICAVKDVSAGNCWCDYADYFCHVRWFLNTKLWRETSLMAFYCKKM